MPLVKQAAFLAAWGLGAYCLLVLLMMSLETFLLYPRGGIRQVPRDFTHEPYWLTTDDGLLIEAWYCPCPTALSTEKEDERPVVLFCHGNGGEISSRAALARRWQETLGADVLLFDYRGFGRSEGTPYEQGLYRDSRAAYRWLTDEFGIDPDRIMLCGASLGAAVALELALEVPHRALILLCPFAGAPEVAAELYPWLPVRMVMRNRFPSYQRIAQYRGKLFLTHGERDAIIPVSHGKRLFEAAGEPKGVLIRPDRGHNDIADGVFFDEVRRFLQQ
ncbi:2-hydroxy-6-oxo-6-phenylhexa-2,4-dienoate hydrolase [Planctomycetes bacterium Pan216]|uniref:2-hydroxy-6-oxo-6-phenylhexa-2,4-dienoate hydrolase n=1 Tax=Kolteria novifilia TaxID=2527975 RepID=A0A518B6A0_9BACT|nr:2-hydroxy-6-oxo-6-phenylhexa-2,4-dienoate hydrolase [Planctomycetes bacterium Pan216]